MYSSIFVIDKDNKFVEMKQTQFETEDIFQEIIEKYPNILAGEQINPNDPRRWILVSREIGIPSEANGGNQWFLDHLFIDQDAVPTFVEVKRSTDTRVRREVVAQMLDYAANATSYWEIDTLRECYETQLEQEKTLSLETIGMSASNEDMFWGNVETNLKVGKIRLMFVADEIPMSLQRIIEFLNEQMTETEVLGLEIKHYESIDGMKTLVPKIIGRTSTAVQAKKNEKGTWDEESFLNDVLNISGEQAVKTCKKLIQEFESFGCRIWWGRGRTHGSFIPTYDGRIASHQLCSIYQTDKTTLVELQFQHFKEPFVSVEAKKGLKQKFETIPGLIIDEQRLNKRPSFDLSLIFNENHLKLFLEIYKEYIERVKEYEATNRESL
ncbi:hypothetical protein [Bacillus dakarensis]|uniref:hypothetical protein n=1 Tax=Robertmurraya dakarensis TaxID=1926278 RepID=UPI0009811E73|nr:hypothetical protein [Bacillus dakarensis]